jgi:putative chitinase
MGQAAAKHARAYLSDSPERIAEFIAELAHETQGFTRWEENLNYSARGLANTWPSRYAVNPAARIKMPNAKAKALARRPEAIANDTYGLRLGNLPGARDTDTNPDGWQYRGRGGPMITGRANYEEMGRFVGLDFVRFPELAADPAVAVLTALEFMKRRGVFGLVDRGDFKNARAKVQGGSLGLAEVAAIRNKLLKVLK